MPRAIRAPFPAVPAAGLEFHPDASTTWSAMLADIASARQRVWFENFILDDGVAADALLRAFESAIAHGAQVRVLVDDFGSNELSAELKARIERAGVQLRFYNPIEWLKIPWNGWRRYVRRTHRRIVVVDQRIAWSGGMAISDRWWPSDSKELEGLGPNHPEVNDAMLRMQGELVGQLALAFDDLWSGERLPSPRKYPAAEEGQSRALIQHPLRRLHLHRELSRALGSLRKSAWIATPYFIPPRKLRRALRHAARRGCDVRLLLPGALQHDHPAVRVASRRYYYRLLRAGVRIFEYQPAFQHAKVGLLDGQYTLVGSFNLDRWSWLWNHEIMISNRSESLAQTVESWFELQFADSDEIDVEQWCRRSLWARIAERFFGLFDRWF